MKKIDLTAILLSRLFGHIKLTIPKNKIQKILAKSANVSSFSTLQDTLSFFNIKSLVIQFELAKIGELPLPFFVRRKDEFPLLVVAVSDEKIECYEFEGSGLLSLDRYGIEKLWDNHFLLVEETPNSGYKRTLEERLKNYLDIFSGWFFVVVLLGCIVYAGLTQATIPFVLVIINIVGGVLSFFMLQKEFGQDKGVFNDLCNARAGMSCDAVLKSKLSKRIKPFSFAGLSLSFFIGNILMLYIKKVSFIYLGFSFIAAFFVIFTVYYQWKYVKKWCILCLSLSALVWLNVIVASYFNFTESSVWFAFFSYILGFYLYVLIRKNLDLTNKRDRLERQDTWFKRNLNIFDLLVSQSPKLENRSPVYFYGDIDSKQKLSLILHPNCSACVRMLRELANIMLLNDELKIEISIFYLIGNADAEARMINFSHLYSNASKQESIEFLLDWFSEKVVNTFTIEKSGELLEMIKENNEFIQSIKPKSFPTIFYNNHIIPSIYSPVELKILLAK